MTADQIHLELTHPASGRPVVDGADVDRFIRWLSGRGWMLRREIERQTGWNERQQRAWAEASGGHVLGSQRGYRLTCQATPAERDACLSRMRGQRDTMKRRIKDIFNVHLRGKVPACLLR